MLRIVIIFMLLTLIGSPMNTTSLENTSINKSLLNNSSLNSTQKSDLGIDINPFIWFSKPTTKPDVAANLMRTLDDIRHDYLKNAVDSYSAGKSMTEEEFSRLSIPPAINEELDRYNPGPKEEPGTIEFPDDEWSPWLQKPPWDEEGMERGCAEPVCDEDGICYQQCLD